MKTFDDGHETMTVGELRAKLSEYPDDMPVLTAWEGQSVSVRNFEVRLFGATDRCDTLFIDADNY